MYKFDLMNTHTLSHVSLLLMLLTVTFMVATPLIFTPSPAQAAALVPTRLRCEYRVNPLGVDSASPRLDWILQPGSPTARGLRQTAYHVLVASSPNLLARDRGDLWNSGTVQSDQMNQIAYAGKPLKSSQQVFWKVRVVDQAGASSAWSASAQWTMGILRDADWQGAKWIGAVATTVGAAAKHSTLIGYHAAEAQQDEVKWVQADLGKAVPISSVRLYPMQHAGIEGFGFPLRFTVQAASDANFLNPVTIADETVSDYPSPGIKPVSFLVNNLTARYLRVTAAKLWLRPASVTGTPAYCFALRRLEVDSGGHDLAAGTAVTAKDSVENSEWGKAALTLASESPAAVAMSASTNSLLLRRHFTVKPRLIRALAFICGLGQYEMTVNGVKAGDDVLAPGWTKYDKTCLYDTRDITALLHPGENAVGLFLGNGFYNIHPGRYTKITGSFGPQRAIGLLRMVYADGTTDNIITDERWRVGAGPITFSSIYGGEAYDARLVKTGWDKPGFDAAGWEQPVITAGPGGVLRGLSAAAPQIRSFAMLKPVSSKSLSPNVTVYDLGQNASLMLRLKVKGPAGSSVKITPSELVGDTGDINDTMCGGNSYWTYTLNGAGDETYLSHFYYRGGRYLKVERQPAPDSDVLPVVESVAGDVIRADAPSVGQFSCSNERYNKVFSLVRWAQMNNMVSVMTDCPTREKLGWLEEDHLNGPALRYNFDMSTMMSKMVSDMADSQRDNGLVPSTCPDLPRWDEGAFTNPPEWGSACIAVPWQQYQFEGDLELLRRHYSTMKRYVDYLSAKSNGQIVSFGLGDWYDNHGFGAATLTPIGITATAFYYYDSETLAKIAKLLGKTDDAARYEQQAGAILAAYNQRFFNASTNNYATGSQASNAFPLAMGIVPSANRPAVLENLAKDLQSKGPTAGEVRFKYLLQSLADGGHSELLYTTFNTDTQGYGLQVKQGKTSLTEGWNGGASQDHFMFGQINEWFYRSLAGIQADPDRPGFQKIIIKPALVSDLNWVKARYDSIQGTIVSEWTRSGSAVTLHVVIPANTTGTVYVPADDPHSVRESGKPITQGSGIKFLRMRGWDECLSDWIGQLHILQSVRQALFTMSQIKVGLFSIGLAAYWPQFPRLRERLSGYGMFVGNKISALGTCVIDAGMVDDQPSALAAGDRFAREQVDIVVCYVTTYATSSQVVPAVQSLGKPVLILNLQPTAQLDYLQTGTAEWLANCQACCVPEIACAFERCGIPFATVTGVLGLEMQTPGALADEVAQAHPAAVAAWEEVGRWLAACRVKRALARSRIGFLGHTYPGMLDMYSDFTQHTGQFGAHIEVLEMDDLEARVKAVTGAQAKAKRDEARSVFDVSETSPSDHLAQKPGPEALEWACRVAVGLDTLVHDFDLQGLAYYHRGVSGNEYESLGAGVILGCSLLTGRGVPCSGEGDLKNCIAMKVMDTLGAGGSFTELYAMDFAEKFILMGHDGPFHPGISEGRPILRGLGLYHGKRGGGVSVEAHVKHGPVTILGLTQTRAGRLKWLCAEGWSLPGDWLHIGNTNSRLRFTPQPDDDFHVAAWMNRWASEGPTHHVALGVGHQKATLLLLAQLLNMECALV